MKLGRILSFVSSAALGGIVMGLISLPGEIQSERRLYENLANDEEFQKAVANKVSGGIGSEEETVE